MFPNFWKARQEMTTKAAVKKFSDLTSDWPPSVIEGRANLTYPIKWDQASVTGPVFVDKECVRFYVKYEGHAFLCSSQAFSEESSAEAAKILEGHVGSTVQAIEIVEIPSTLI